MRGGSRAARPSAARRWGRPLRPEGMGFGHCSSLMRHGVSALRQIKPTKHSVRGRDDVSGAVQTRIIEPSEAQSTPAAARRSARRFMKADRMCQPSFSRTTLRRFPRIGPAGPAVYGHRARPFDRPAPKYEGQLQRQDRTTRRVAQGRIDFWGLRPDTGAVGVRTRGLDIERPVRPSSRPSCSASRALGSRGPHQCHGCSGCMHYAQRGAA
jgi:hypothetical protein